MVKATRRAIKIGFLTFTVSLVISYLFQFTLVWWLSLSALFVVVLTGILFDLIGTSVTAANEAPFHAMGTDKIAGSRQAIYLIRHADRVANFCNDVVGDAAGTISGAIIASIALQFVQKNSFLPKDIINAAAIALIAAVTVGGKSLGKSYAIRNANQILFTVGKALAFLNLASFDSKKYKRKFKASPRKVRKT